MYNRNPTNSNQLPPNIINAFPMGIGLYKNDNHQKVKEILTEMMKKAPFQHNENCNGLIHYFDDNDSVLTKSNLRFFREWIEEQALIFTRDVLGYAVNKLNVTDSWLNVSNKDAFQPPHMHTNSFISGTYYVNKTDRHSPLIFKNLRFLQDVTTNAVMHLDNGHPTLYNSDLPIDTQEGYLVLWESYMIHGYPPNQSDDRVSLSMNLMPSKVSYGRYSFNTVRR